MQNIQPQYFTIKELSTYSGFAARTIRYFIKDPRYPLPYFRVGSKSIRVRKSDFDNWMSKFRIDTNSKVDTFIDDIMKEIR